MTNTKRYLAIVIRTDRLVMEFEEPQLDSQALHFALSMIDPGSNYSVTFSDRKPRQTKNTVALYQRHLYDTVVPVDYRVNN